jgi:hypothetical protein
MYTRTGTHMCILSRRALALLFFAYLVICRRISAGQTAFHGGGIFWIALDKCFFFRLGRSGHWASLARAHEAMDGGLRRAPTETCTTTNAQCKNQDMIFEKSFSYLPNAAKCRQVHDDLIYAEPLIFTTFRIGASDP